MEFLNHTPFPALAFEGIDQHDQSFHVIVLRQTLTFASGKIEYADAQAPLCEIDEFFGAMNESSVRQESDLCHFKPKCDIIVNATAYAPQNRPTAKFDVRLQVTRPGAKKPLPEPPRGLNPMMSASDADMAKWRREVARIEAEGPPILTLVDKTLTVTGSRAFENKGIFGLGGWELTNPQKILSLPLRYEYAFGGQCRINRDHKASARINKRNLLTTEQISQHPDREHPPAAHTVFELNHVGRGYAEKWYLDATECTTVPAPQIESPHAPISASLFNGIYQGKPNPTFALSPSGFGIRAKVHPERRVLAGKVDIEFVKSNASLPKDFDFAVWNAACPDQQVDYLVGNESFSLTNLCAPGAHGTALDAHGNTLMHLTLPNHACTLLLRMENGTMFFHPMRIDTLLIDMEQQQVSVVWRAVIGKDVNLRAVNLRLHRENEAEFARLVAEAARKQLTADVFNRDTKMGHQHG